MDKVTREYRAYCAKRRKEGLPQTSFSNFMRMRQGQKRNVPSMHATSLVRQSPKIPSGDLFDYYKGDRKPEKVYTGTRLIGIATMHKSNSVPVFRKEDAEDIARMRR